jgi:hypothetical protein
MKDRSSDNTFVLSNALRTSVWVWALFLIIMGVIMYVLWLVRFPKIIKTDIILHRKNSTYYVSANIPGGNGASIVSGQSIRFWLNDYPEKKNVYFTGELKKVSVINNQGDLEIIIGVLQNQLLLDNKNTEMPAGTKGTAIIILDDQRLFSRLLQSISIVKK